jgi:hypothetical protein
MNLIPIPIGEGFMLFPDTHGPANPRKTGIQTTEEEE